MRTKTFTYYVYAVQDADADGGIRYSLGDYKWHSPDDRVLIGTHTVEHDIPDVTEQVVVILETKRDVMRATANAAITEVDNQIASLLALEHKVEA